MNNTDNSAILSITFCGAARTVTGSMYFLEYVQPSGKIFRFVLDAGMFQVGQDVSLFKMNSHLLFEPKLVDALILTHCHLDHCGRIPFLVKRGFGGRIYSTLATKELAEIVLLDAAKQQDQNSNDQKYHLEELGLNKDDLDPNLNPDWYVPKNLGKVEALYGNDEVQLAISRFKTHSYHQEFELCEGLWVEFRDAGHILGSANVIISEKNPNGEIERQIIFSGDLGNPNKPIIRDPEIHKDLYKLTHVVVESTYGDRLHPKLEPKLRLKEIVKNVVKKQGKLLIPSFSVERAQEVIYYLAELMRDNEIPQMPIFLDSPMASRVLEVCLDHSELYDQDLKDKINQKANPLIYKQLKILETIEDSKTLNGKPGPYILIAGSGMLNGGRILKHLLHDGSNSQNTLLFVGYQAQGTLGRQILELWKAKEKILIQNDGINMEVKAEIAIINEFSAHADQAMIKNWVSEMVLNRKFNPKNSPNNKLTVFITHGEHSASQTLAHELEAAHPSKLQSYWPKFGEKMKIW